MKRILLYLIIITVFNSCEKEEELDVIPDYQPGRLIEVVLLGSNEYVEDFTCHEFEYLNNEVVAKYTDRRSSGIIESHTYKYYFIDNKLKKVTNTIGNDSLLYFYNDSQIAAIPYSDGNPYDTAYYFIENDKIYYYEDIDGSNYRKFFYAWYGGDNLLKINEKYKKPFGSYVEKEYNYVYTDLENPFFHFNIPLLETNDTHVRATETSWLDLIPKCSKYLPSYLTISFDKGDAYRANEVWSYSFKYKTFQDVRKPYEVEVTFKVNLVPVGYPNPNNFALIYEKL